ncbi:MAG: 23S rRNA (guanosine(2251)-2'-O)-methyltransferase RlmB, partial [Bacteroidota bacterium]
RLFLQNGLKGDLMNDLKSLAREHRIDPVYVPAAKLNRITAKNHQGAVAFISPVAFESLEALVPMLFEQGKNPLILVLDGITDIRNFGAIVRSADGAGVDAIVIPSKGAAQVSSDAVKTSAGALFHVPVCKEASLDKAVELLQHSGIQVVACSEKGADPYADCDLSVPTAIVMGSEEKGVSTNILRKCDRMAMIPMQGKVGSLNVSVACGILLYESVRQRSKALANSG